MTEIRGAEAILRVPPVVCSRFLRLKPAAPPASVPKQEQA